jgi:cytokinin dehydrogenase
MTSPMRLSRRGFVRTLVGESLVVGFNAATRSWVAAADGRARAPFERVPRLDGALLLDEVTRRAHAQDYGQIVHEQPSAVLRPGSVGDISRMVGFARRFGLRITARGQGDQPFGQAQVSEGVVIDMRSLGAVHSVFADRLEVDAGADWRGVVEAALRHGLTPPVLTAYLGLTVGGTLSVGGVGTTTFRHGAQVDHVHDLQVVKGEGQVLTCSETRHRDLFEVALAGQGQCAIITRAVLRLVPAASSVREYVLPYPDLATLLRDGALLTEDGRFDGVVGLIAPSEGLWSYALTATRQFSLPDAPDDAALKAGWGIARAPSERETSDICSTRTAFRTSSSDRRVPISGSAFPEPWPRPSSELCCPA